MTDCDVLIVGGGPAGSSCAWKLRNAGLHVVVVDRATYPRDKVCGGWITPQVVADLQLDIDTYGQQRTLQPIRGFRTGLIGGRREIETRYETPVSYGIRRCEFDDYLLRRAGADVRTATPVTTLRREGARWIVNDSMTAPLIVGAGGHFCPVARHLNGGADPCAGAPLVVAQEVEFAVDSQDRSFTTAPDIPELYFCRDLKGYGWCFRKQDFINIGFGRADRRSLPKATAEFVAFLERRGRIPPNRSWHWRGHAYLLQDRAQRRIVDSGALLVGDAAGLAYPQSGEGIRPAIESGLLAATTIAEANGCYTRDRLATYEARLRSRFFASTGIAGVSRVLPSRMQTAIAGVLLKVPSFVRHVALDRWFLHADTPPLRMEMGYAGLAGSSDRVAAQIASAERNP